MKKILALILISVSVLSASAQMLKSRTLMKRENPTMWYGRLGMQIDNITGLTKKWKDDGISLSPKVGMDLDFGFNKPIGKSGAYWGMDLGIITRGGSYKESLEDDYDYRSREYYDPNEKDEEEPLKETFSSWALKYSPFTFGYKYSVTDNLKIDAHLGAYVSFDFSQKWSSNDDSSYDDPEMDEIFENRFDVGIQVGVGAWYQKFNLDFSYQRGFIDYINYFGDQYFKTSAFVIRLGYAF
ncbi:MAG: PorT family protein [Muribaculaceae bacterium]|nr:PorT family protein [Muribaculaceae bacterium]